MLDAAEALSLKRVALRSADSLDVARVEFLPFDVCGQPLYVSFRP